MQLPVVLGVLEVLSERSTRVLRRCKIIINNTITTTRSQLALMIAQLALKNLFIIIKLIEILLLYKKKIINRRLTISPFNFWLFLNKNW